MPAVDLDVADVECPLTRRHDEVVDDRVREAVGAHAQSQPADGRGGEEGAVVAGRDRGQVGARPLQAHLRSRDRAAAGDHPTRHLTRL